MDKFEREIQTKETVIEDLQRKCAVLKEWVENTVRLK
jgi:hypothetical protein